MTNNTIMFHFNLTMYVNIGPYRYPAFILCFLMFSIIVSANLVLILAISCGTALHEPMYIFIAVLSSNSIYGCTGFFPRFLVDLLSDTHLISRPSCFTQIYIIFTYAAYEMSILSIMAYDRYVAICNPLHYHSKVTMKTVCRLAVFALTSPVILILICLFLTVRLPLCGNKILRLYCANWNVVKLSCVPTFSNNIVGFLVTATTVIFPLIYVLYTYFRIILVCRKSSSEFKSRVFQTCLPHTVSFTTYSVSLFFDIALSRVNVEKLNPFFAAILSLEFIIIPPILNPLVYGLKLPEIRRHIFRMLSCSNRN